MEYRYDLINHLIQKHGYTRYLEIGTQNSICGSNVKCKFKFGVDPNPIQRINGDFNEHFIMKSDDFFNNNELEKLGPLSVDLVFIDGLHTYEQVRKDFINSTKITHDKSCIVLHDCLPTTEERAKSFDEGGIWNGDCYRLIQDLEDSGTKFYIADFDQGCAVIYRKDINRFESKNQNLSFQEWQSKLKNKTILNANDIINLSL